MTDHKILKDKELFILDLIAQGKSNPEIARELHLSPNTIKIYVKMILEKLNVESRVSAAAKGFSLGLIDYKPKEKY